MTSRESATVPMPITPGGEMDALRRFHPDVTWTGTINENGMGPGSPPMTAVGRGTHRLIQGGRWIVGDYEQDQFGPDGAFVLTWQLHWVAGWDPTNQEYRATLADNYGHADVMHGHITGDRLVFETVAAPPRSACASSGMPRILPTSSGPTRSPSTTPRGRPSRPTTSSR